MDQVDEEPDDIDSTSEGRLRCLTGSCRGSEDAHQVYPSKSLYRGIRYTVRPSYPSATVNAV